MRNAPSKIIKNIFWIFILVCPVFSHAYTDNYPAFSTNGFLAKDGSLLVSEEFIFDFGDVGRHGVIRTMPLVSDNGKRWYEIKNIDVKNQEKQQLDFDAQTSGNTASIKIGNQNITLTGTHYFNLRYSISNIGSDTEIKWSVIKAVREPIGKFRAQLFFPVMMMDGIATSSCGFIPASPTDYCTTQPIYKDNRVIGFVVNAENLKNREVYLSAKYPRGIIESSYVEKDNTIHYKKYLKIIIPSILLLVSGFFVFRYRKNISHYYKELKKHAISPDQYSYLERAMYYHGEIKKEDIVSTVADLTERGYLSLEQFAHPLGANEFIDYSVVVLTDEIDNELEKIIINKLDGVTSLSEWLMNNFDELKPKLEEIAKENIKDVKMYRRDIEDIPKLVGFKIF